MDIFSSCLRIWLEMVVICWVVSIRTPCGLLGYSSLFWVLCPMVWWFLCLVCHSFLLFSSLLFSCVTYCHVLLYISLNVVQWQFHIIYFWTCINININIYIYIYINKYVSQVWGLKKKFKNLWMLVLVPWLAQPSCCWYVLVFNPSTDSNIQTQQSSPHIKQIWFIPIYIKITLNSFLNIYHIIYII